MWKFAAFSALALASTDVELVTVDGKQPSSQLVAINRDTVAVRDSKGSAQTISMSSVRQLVFRNQPASTKANCWLELVDDSRIVAKELKLLDGQMTISSTEDDGEWKLEGKAVRFIRWSESEEQLDRQWAEILKSRRSADVLVIRRSAGTLDYLPGVIKSISDGKVQFEYEGSEIPVPLAKVDGVIFFQTAVELPSARFRLTTTDGSVWNLELLDLQDDVVHITTVSGIAADLAIGRLQQIDFAELNSVYLSDLEPTSTNFTPYLVSPRLAAKLEDIFQPRRDLSYEGAPLQLLVSNSPGGNREYEKGLAIHSRTKMVYRLAGQYRQFQAEVGIDPNSSSGSANVVISADGRILFEKEIASGQVAERISVDVSLAKRLTILVDFGNNLDIADRVHLCDAKLIK